MPARPDARRPDRAPDGRWVARYDTLDMWRGLAAIAIVLRHMGEHQVDFGVSTGRVVVFFLISGYCIAASAESCSRRGMTALQFFKRRAHRIYPPYLLAILYWMVASVINTYTRGAPNALARSPITWLQNLTLTQWTSLLNNPTDQPWDNPALFVQTHWTLGYEEQFYLVVTAAFAIAAAFRRVPIWAMLSAPVLAAFAWGFFHPVELHGIFLEYYVSFGLGALVYYRLAVFTSMRARVMIDLLLLVIAVGAAIGWRIDPRDLGAERSKWPEWMVAGVFGLILVALRPADKLLARSSLLFPLRYAGVIAYSLFLIHNINNNTVHRIAEAVIPPSWPEVISVGFKLFLHVALASVFWFFCELPFRNRRIDPPPDARVAA